MAFSEIALRLAMAALCGGAIGFEREQQRKPAGLRTHMLVAIGSAAFILAAFLVEPMENPNTGAPLIQVDPSRVIQGIAGGIGFLGAGAILRSNGSVYGLTTAATIWVVGAVGICCGLGEYLLASMVSLLVVSIAGVLGMFERWLYPRKVDGENAENSSGKSPEDESPPGNAAQG